MWTNFWQRGSGKEKEEDCPVGKLEYMISQEICIEIMTFIRSRLWPYIPEFLIEWFPESTADESLLIKLPANEMIHLFLSVINIFFITIGLWFMF